MSARTSRLALAIGAAALFAISGHAHAEVDPMPLGAMTAPPLGFVDMCERRPALCVVNRNPSQSQLDGVRRWAGQTRWAIIFTNGRLSPDHGVVREAKEGTASAGLDPRAHVSAPTRERAADVAMSSVLVPIGGMPGAMPGRARLGSMSGRPWNLNQGHRSVPSPGAVEVIRATSVSPPPTGADGDWAPPRFITELTSQKLSEINREINRTIRPSNDMRIFGRAEYWTIPRGPGALGDCEDYVLAKREALINAGAPIESLSIAVVRTRRDDLHTVLLVATPEGEVVLDNLSSSILSWREAPYTWLQRQSPGSALTWVAGAA